MPWVTVTSNPPVDQPFRLTITSDQGIITATFVVNEPQKVEQEVAEFMAQQQRCVAAVTTAKPKPKPDLAPWPAPDQAPKEN